MPLTIDMLEFRVAGALCSIWEGRKIGKKEKTNKAEADQTFFQMDLPFFIALRQHVFFCSQAPVTELTITGGPSRENPMAIRVTCPYCSREYSLKDRELGKSILCRSCRKEFIVDDPGKVKEPTKTGSAQAGWASLTLGLLSMCAVMLACCTLGFSLFAAIPLALAGLVLGFYGQGGFKLAGPILNGLVLAMALCWVMVFWFSAGRSTPDQDMPMLPGMERQQEIKKLP